LILSYFLNFSKNFSNLCSALIHTQSHDLELNAMQSLHVNVYSNVLGSLKVTIFSLHCSFSPSNLC